jgi:hypothetical protein
MPKDGKVASEQNWTVSVIRGTVLRLFSCVLGLHSLSKPWRHEETDYAQQQHVGAFFHSVHAGIVDCRHDEDGSRALQRQESHSGWATRSHCCPKLLSLQLNSVH